MGRAASGGCVPKGGSMVKMGSWIEQDHKYFMDTGHRRLGIVLVKGSGTKVWDDQGKEYLDFLGGWAVTNLGHCHPVLVEALKRQADELWIGSSDVYTIPQIKLAELLMQHTCFDKVFFANSGAEANEGAIKLARKYGKLHLSGAFRVISAFNSFHGRTLAMVAATGKPAYQAPYLPLPDGFDNVAYDDINAIMQATKPETCAVLLEPIQGEGGVIVPSPDYFRKVREWCDERGLLLILDEIQTGCGRTGGLFAYTGMGVEPDIMTIGKGLGGGVPIAAILAKDHAAVFGHGDHGSTYGGNPLMCATAFASVRYIIDHDIPAQAWRMGDYLANRLREIQADPGAQMDDGRPMIKEVRGRGLLLAAEFEMPIVEDLVNSARDNGLLLNPNRPTIVRMMPPLTVTTEEVDAAMDIFQASIARARKAVPAP